MASFKYNLQKPYEGTTKAGDKKLNTKETRLYLYLILDRENMAKFKTEFNIRPIHWNFDEKKLKHQVAGSKIINDALDTLRKSVENEYNRIREDYPDMSFKEIIANLKVYVKTKVNPVYAKDEKDIFNILDEYLENRLDDVSALTLKKYTSLKKSLLDFNPDININDIDLRFFDKYVRYLRTRKPAGRQKTRAEGSQAGLLDDTVSKYIESLKNFLKWAYERGYHSNTIFKHTNFTIKRRAKHDIVTLHLDELQHFYNFDFSDSVRLEKVRDVFCFACFTGQRWSDVERFNKDNIDSDVWEFDSYKTKKRIIVPLVGYSAPALDILRKYDFELPIISAQKFNEFLKEAGKSAGLERPVQIKRYIGKKEIITSKPLHEFMSSHMARRTAVSLLLNVEGMPIHMVRDITGHSDIKTLDKYLNKDSSALRERLSQTKGVNNLRIVKDENKNAV